MVTQAAVVVGSRAHKENIMRRLATGLAALLLTVCLSGCIMIIGVREPVELSDGKKVVAIDGDLYVVDVDEKRVEKLDTHTVRETEISVTTEEKGD